MTTLAIDIGGTKLAAALVDAQHRVLEKDAANASQQNAGGANGSITRAGCAFRRPAPAGSGRLHGHYSSRRTDCVKSG